MVSNEQNTSPLDPLSVRGLASIAQQEAVLAKRVPEVKFILIVLSARGLVYDLEALRQKVLVAYPQAAIFFQNTAGNPIGIAAPAQVDLLIDFTGPGQRQGWLLARSLRKRARVAVGRNAGWFRKSIYDRIFDELSPAESEEVPTDLLAKEHFIQKKLLNLAGVSLFASSEACPDQSKTLALKSSS